jgi:hypothetical protein
LRHAVAPSARRSERARHCALTDPAGASNRC